MEAFIITNQTIAPELLQIRSRELARKTLGKVTQSGKIKWISAIICSGGSAGENDAEKLSISVGVRGGMLSVLHQVYAGQSETVKGSSSVSAFVRKTRKR